MRIASLVSGILLVAAGIWCFTNSGFTFLSFAFLPGCVILFSGLCNIASYFIKKDPSRKGELYATEGIWSVLFGILILGDFLITDEIAVVCFGMWILSTSIHRGLEGLRQLREKRIDGIFFLAFAVVGIPAGLLAFLNPLVGGFGLVVLMGLMLFLQGGNQIVLAVQMKKGKGNKHKEMPNGTV